MKRISLILCSLLFLASALRVSDFHQGVFTSGQPYGFWQVVSLPESPDGQINLAYADFNSDKYTDIIVTDNHRQNLYIYLWDAGKSEFRSYLTNLTVYSFGIVSVIPSDYNFDGNMDLLVTYENSYQSQRKYDIYIFFGNNCQNDTCIFTKDIEYSWRKLDLVQPFLLDNEGKNIPSIFIVERQVKKVLVFDEDKYVKKLFDDIVVGDPTEERTMRSDHFAAVVDFNGDCFADLVFLNNEQFIEFYELQTNISKYKLVKNQTERIFSIKYADMNNDGAVDIVEMVPNNKYGLDMYIVYNTQGAKEICTYREQFPFDFSPESPYREKVNFPVRIASPLTLSISDANMDGYPDILITLQSSYQDSIFSYLYLNLECSNCTKSTRTFESSSIYEKITSTFPGVVTASFFDLGQDGTLDIILNLKTSPYTYTMKTIINNLKQDSFFIKSLPLSVYSSDDELIPVFGATFQWRITTLEGHSKIAFSPQLSQLSHTSLQLPFISQGLGRTNNYIQDFTVGYVGKDEIQSWTPIIPNSKLIITPNGKEWKLGVYVNPNSKIRDVIVITVVILILIGVGIVYLVRKEVMQDRNNPSMFFQLIR